MDVTSKVEPISSEDEVKNMMRKYHVYKCKTCGNTVKILREGEGNLVCCGESMVPSGIPSAGSSRTFLFLGLLVGVAVIVLVLTGSMWSLFMVSIKPGMIGIVFNERGKTDPDGHFIVEKGYKGLQREVLFPGKHFFWQTTAFMVIEQVPMTVIPEGKVGVLIAQDGRPLPQGAALAEDDEIDPDTGNLIRMGQKGIRKHFLKPGTYPINTKYLEVELHSALNIKPGKLGVLIRNIGEPAPDDQIIVPMDSNYRGIIKELLEPGIRYLHPYVYQWEIHDPLKVESGKVGVLTRKIGDPPPNGQYMVPMESNYRGIIRELLEPGTYFLHPKIYSWETVDAVTIPEEKVGILIRKVGTPPPSGTILVNRASEYQGIIKELLEPGLYYLNPYEFEVEVVDSISIPDGFVGVMIAKTGKPAPVGQLLVEEEFRGVRKDYLKPGIYYINLYEFDIVPVDTRAQKYEMADLSDQGGPSTSEAIQFLSKNEVPIRVEVSVLYSIQPENAPYVVATLGKNLDDVKTKIIRPGSRSFVRIEGSMLNAEELLNKETRKTFQDKLMESLREEGGRAKVTIINVFVRNYTFPEDFLKKK